MKIPHKKTLIAENKIRVFLLWVIMYNFFFGSTICGIKTRNVVIVIAIGYVLLRINRVRELLRIVGINQFYIFLGCSCLWCSGLLYRAIFWEQNSTSYYVSYKLPIYIVAEVFVMAFFSALSFKNAKEFANVICSLMIMQSIIVVGSIFLKPVKRFLQYFLRINEGSHLALTLNASSRGVGINLFGASGAVTLLTAQVLLVYLLCIKEISQRKFVFSYFMIMVGEMFLGRTGFYFGIILLFAYILIEKKIKFGFSLFIKAVLIGTVAIVSMMILVWVALPDMYQRLYEWIFEGILNLKNSQIVPTVKIINQMNVPEITWETLWGTSVARGTSYYGTVLQNDSGYIQNYFAFGLIGVIAYYLGYFVVFMLPIIKRKVSCVKFLEIALTIMFILDYKEPFIRVNAKYPFVLLTIVLFEVIRFREVQKGEK